MGSLLDQRNSVEKGKKMARTTEQVLSGISADMLRQLAEQVALVESLKEQIAILTEQLKEKETNGA